MAHRLFEGKEHAACYWKYRIAPPDHLVQHVLSFLEEKRRRPFELAVDVGCGSGQGTVLLAGHFSAVVGTDVSPAQLEVALKNTREENITYRQCAAEELPFADGSADLVTAMSAFHWFDRPRFLREAHRVLRPSGCLALLNYSIDMELSHPGCCPLALNSICKEFYAALQPYRSPHLGASSLEMYRQAYLSIPYPEREWQECVLVRRSMSLRSYMGLVESFSSYQALLRDDPSAARRLSQDVLQRLMSVTRVTSEDTEVVVGVKYFYLLARKPQEGGS